ncbi:suppressor of fused domain protein [Paenibacillus sp. Z6-24]
MNDKQVAKDIRLSIKKGDIDTFLKLIDDNPDQLKKKTPFGTWLHVASSEGQLEIVKKLIKLGADINASGGIYGGGALNEAASEGHYEVVEYLLSYGVKLDVSEPEKNPLFGAISNGHVNIVKLLIKNGIDTKVKYTGETMKERDALAFAKEQGQKDIIKLLGDQNKQPVTIYKNNSHEDHSSILRYFTEYFGPIENTISEIVSGSKVSIDINIIPDSNQGYLTLVTTGMSDEPMDYSNEEKTFKYAELVFKLPSSWPTDQKSMQDPQKNWPLQWIRRTAHIPHLYEGWIEAGVILPNGEPPQPFASNTKLSSILLCTPEYPQLQSINTQQGKVEIYNLIPIYEEERNFALKQGHMALLEKMRKAGISDILNINRINCCK